MAQQNPFVTPELDQHYGGLIPSPPDIRDYPWPKLSGHPQAVLGNWDLRDYHGENLCMPVGDQGQIGSCAGWAIGYYMRAALTARYHVDIQTPADLNDTLSPRFMYDMVRGPQYMNTYPQDSGTDLRQGMKILLDYGVPPESDMPYTGRADNGPLANEMTQHVLDAAAYYPVSNYYRLPGTGMALVEAIIGALSAYQPVVIGVLVPRSFEYPKGNGDIPAPGTQDQILGAHAVCLMANFYDNSKPGGGCFQFPNEWGLGWGVGGWANLPWAYALTSHYQYGPYLMEAWTAG